MAYQELLELSEGLTFPLYTKNGAGENVIIERGNDGQQGFFKQITAQHNGWTRINYIYEDGSADELYSKRGG